MEIHEFLYDLLGIKEAARFDVLIPDGLRDCAVRLSGR